jgi:hypothetical protein
MTELSTSARALRLEEPFQLEHTAATSGVVESATRASVGTASLSSSSRLPASSGERFVRPVTLPPGPQGLQPNLPPQDRLHCLP